MLEFGSMERTSQRSGGKNRRALCVRVHALEREREKTEECEGIERGEW